MIENNSQVNILKEVTEERVGERLDKYISSFLIDNSRSNLQKLIKEGSLELNGEKITNNSRKVELGEIYKINIPIVQKEVSLAEDLSLEIIWEDDDLAIINKPAGMTVHPAPGVVSNTLVNALLYQYQDNLSSIGGSERRGIVHRLDKETSGLLIVAKNDKTHEDLVQQFSNHDVEREYVAFTYFMPNPMEGKIESNIGRSFTDRKKMAIIKSGGKFAETDYKTVKTFKCLSSMVICNLKTGRTHQIRVHMASIGCHLIGDKIYVKPKKSSMKFSAEIKEYVNSFPRQALHARKLGFIHPTTKEEMSFEVEMPADMQELLTVLESMYQRD